MTLAEKIDRLSIAALRFAGAFVICLFIRDEWKRQQ